MKNRITVGIVTFNRVDFLKKNLPEALKQLNSDDELLVVDNNSSDGTSDFVSSVRDKRVSLYVERKQGLNNGRNAAIREAKNSYVLLLDDDASPCEGWVEGYRKAVEANDNCALYAGKTINDYEGRSPGYLSKKFEYLLGGKDYGEKIRYLTKAESPGGGNMMVNREIVLKYGGFDPEFDRNGDILIGNGEKELFERIKNEEKILYVPGAAIYHFAPLNRTNKKHLLERMYWQGYSDGLVGKKKNKLFLYKSKRIIFYFSKFVLENIKRIFIEPQAILFSIRLENMKTRGLFDVK
jgi:glycosyltransferase involved in cell wall biosynthesis